MRRLLSTVIAALNVSFMPRFLALRIEHKLDDLISFCVNAIVLAAAQLNPSRIMAFFFFFFEFTARFANLCEMSDKQNDFAADLCSIAPAD